MKSFILKNCKLWDENTFKKVDILVVDNLIQEIQLKILPKNSEAIIDLENLWVFPGFIDAHVHWREPGFKKKETIKTGSLAAAKGGFTTVMTMPNLNPVPDCLHNLKIQLDLVKQNSLIKVLPFGSITKKEAGKELSSIKELAPFVCGYSDDGNSIANPKLMWEAMREAKKVNKIIASHCEEPMFSNKGVINEGVNNQKMNLKGIHPLSEILHVQRDIMLAKNTGCALHICHISTKESLELVKNAKKQGLKVSCEVTPHHLLSNEEDIKEDLGIWKMKPPLRSKEDQEALIKGVKEGVIDIVATDHAPHTFEEKNQGLANSAFGIIGSEFAFALLYTHFVRKNVFSLQRLVEMLTSKVAKIFNLPLGKVKEGGVADLVVIDLEATEKITLKNIKSLGKNTPYLEEKIFGVVQLTIVEGKIVYSNKKWGAKWKK